MKKIRKLVIIFGIVLIFFLILNKSLNNIDELFNYNWGRNIANGKLLYKDFNAIVFPTFPLIMGGIIKIFGEELIVYRIFQIIIFILFELISAKILKSLEIDNKFVFNMLIVILYLALIAIFGLAEYNMLDLLIVLFIINIEIKDNKRISDYLKIGLLVGLSITVKQSVGICVLGISIFYTFFENNSIKEKIKFLIAKIISVFAVIGMMIAYLFITNTYSEFFNYTILGLGSFIDNKLSYFEFLIRGNYLIVLISIFMMIGFVFNSIKVAKYKDKKAICLFLYGLATLTIMYPITNEYHILIGYFPNLILTLYLISKDSKELLNEKVVKSFSITISIVILFFVFAIILNVFKLSRCQKYNHYKYIYIEEYVDKELENVDNFLIEHDNTYIVNTIGVLYMIPLERYNGIFDLVNKGNLGEDGENALIDRIKNMENVYFLVVPSNKITVSSDQNPLKVIEYIENNYEYIKDLERFKVYYAH